MTKYELANKIASRKSTLGCKTSVKETVNLITRDVVEVLSTIDTIYASYQNINEMPEEVYDIVMELRRHIMKYIELVIDDNKVASMKRAIRIMRDDNRIL